MELTKILEGLALVWPEIRNETKYDLAVRFAGIANNTIDREIAALEDKKIDADSIQKGVEGLIEFNNRNTTHN